MSSDTRVRVGGPVLDWSDTDRRAVDLGHSDGCRERVRPAVRAMVSIAARITLGWREYVGDAGASEGPEHFRASANYKTLYADIGITAERAAEAVSGQPGETDRTRRSGAADGTRGQERLT